MPALATAGGPDERGWSEVDAAFSKRGVKLLDAAGAPADYCQSGIPSKFLAAAAEALKEFVPQVIKNHGVNTVPVERIARRLLGPDAEVAGGIQGESKQIGGNFIVIREDLSNPACGRLELGLAERTEGSMVFKLQFGPANLEKGDERLKHFRVRVRLS